MTALEDFNKTLYANQQILGRAKHQLSVINDDYGEAFDAIGKLDRNIATYVTLPFSLGAMVGKFSSLISVPPTIPYWGLNHLIPYVSKVLCDDDVGLNII